MRQRFSFFFFFLFPSFSSSWSSFFWGQRIDSMKMCHHRWRRCHCSKQKEVRNELAAPLMARVSLNWQKDMLKPKSKKSGGASHAWLRQARAVAVAVAEKPQRVLSRWSCSLFLLGHPSDSDSDSAPCHTRINVFLLQFQEVFIAVSLLSAVPLCLPMPAISTLIISERLQMATRRFQVSRGEGALGKIATISFEDFGLRHF